MHADESPRLNNVNHVDMYLNYGFLTETRIKKRLPSSKQAEILKMCPLAEQFWNLLTFVSLLFSFWYLSF